MNAGTMPPAAIVSRIKELAGELDLIGKQALEKVVEAGKLLRVFKAGLPHGEWLPWLEGNFTFSDRTARRWMKISEASEAGRLKLDTVSNLTEAYHKTSNPRNRGIKVPESGGMLISIEDSDDLALVIMHPIEGGYLALYVIQNGSWQSLRRGIRREAAVEALTVISDTDWSHSWQRHVDRSETQQFINILESAEREIINLTTRPS